MNTFIASGPSTRSYTMKRQRYLLGFLTVLSASALAQQDYGAEFRSLPMWSEDAIIPGERDDNYVFLDVDAGQMVLAYPSNLGQRDFGQAAGSYRVERFDLNNQVDASLSVDVQRSGPYFTYRYGISNSARAKQAIRSVRITTTKFGDDDVVFGPARWGAAASPSQVNAVRLAIGRPSGVFLSWYVNDPGTIDDPDASAILPGSESAGFGVTSRLKPGLTLAYVKGGSRPGLRKDMPRAVLEQTVPVMQIEFNSQNVVTVGPKFDAESPKLEIAEDFHRGIGLMVDAGQINGSSPAIRQALRVLKRCLEMAGETGDGSTAACGFDSAFDARPEPGVEADLLNAMRLGLTE